MVFNPNQYPYFLSVSYDGKKWASFCGEKRKLKVKYLRAFKKLLFLKFLQKTKKTILKKLVLAFKRLPMTQKIVQKTACDPEMGSIFKISR